MAPGQHLNSVSQAAIAQNVCQSCGEPYKTAATQFCRKCGEERSTLKDEGDWAILFRKLKFIATTPTFLEVFIGTWLCFAITLALFAYGYMMIPFMCWLWTACVLVLIVLALLFHFLARPGQITVALSMGCFIAVAIGTVGGLYVYDSAAIFPMFYKHARKYTNVVSSEPSAAIADAGKITFNQEVRVDVNKSVGYTREDGMVYCVAPVIDPTKQPRIEYWAAGINCCAQSGEFSCDASANPKAQGGVVVFDNNGWFAPARYPFYQKARAKAEAQFLLQSVGEPIYVRWVEKDNLEYLENQYAKTAMWNIIVAYIVFAILAAAMSFGMWQPRSMVGK